MKLPTNTTELRALAHAANRALYLAEQKERGEAHKALLNKCFRYRNNYGTDERWWLYAKVIAVKGGDVVLFKFQTDTNGEVTINQASRHSGVSSGYSPITNRLFDAEWRKLQKRLARMKP